MIDELLESIEEMTDDYGIVGIFFLIALLPASLLLILWKTVKEN